MTRTMWDRFTRLGQEPWPYATNDQRRRPSLAIADWLETSARRDAASVFLPCRHASPSGRLLVGCPPGSREGPGASSRGNPLEQWEGRDKKDDCSWHHPRDDPCIPVASVHCNQVHLVASRCDPGCIRGGSPDHHRHQPVRPSGPWSSHSRFHNCCCSHLRRKHRQLRKHSGVPDMSCNCHSHSYRSHRRCSLRLPIFGRCDEDSRSSRPKEPRGLRPLLDDSCRIPSERRAAPGGRVFPFRGSAICQFCDRPCLFSTGIPSSCTQSVSPTQTE